MIRVAVSLMLLIVLSVQARHFYVSPTGDNSHDGSFQTPWKDISFATCGGSGLCPCTQTNANVLTAGDTLYVMPGTWSDALIKNMRFNNSGEAGRPIVIRGYDTLNMPLLNNSDGTGEAIFNIDNRNYITLEYLRLYNNNAADEAGAVRIGYDYLSTGNTVQHCQIRSDGSTAAFGAHIYLNNAPYTTVAFNHIYGGDIIGVLIYRSATNTTVLNNLIHDGHRGIFNKHGGSPCQRLRIENNVLYGYGANPAVEICSQRSTIRNNLILGSVAIGANTWETWYDTLENNTVYTDQVALNLRREDVENSKYTVLRRNIFYSTARAAMTIWQYRTTLNDFTDSDSNCFYSGGSGAIAQRGTADYSTVAQWHQASGQDQHSLQTNPQFTDAGLTKTAVAGYRLLSGSACRPPDMGADLGTVGIVSVRNSRQIGRTRAIGSLQPYRFVNTSATRITDGSQNMQLFTLQGRQIVGQEAARTAGAGVFLGAMTQPVHRAPR